MSLLYRKEPDLMRIHGLRPLTWRDRLLWIRYGRMVLPAAVWIAIVLFLLSLRWSIGPWTVAVVVTLGVWGSAIATIDAHIEDDLRRWPRRDITSPPLHSR